MNFMENVFLDEDQIISKPGEMHGLYFINKGTINVFKTKRSVVGVGGGNIINHQSFNPVCIDDNIYKELDVLFKYIYFRKIKNYKIRKKNSGENQLANLRKDIHSDTVR